MYMGFDKSPTWLPLPKKSAPLLPPNLLYKYYVMLITHKLFNLREVEFRTVVKMRILSKLGLNLFE